MGLAPDFKRYLEAEFPEAVRRETPGQPAAQLLDGMVSLHQWSARDPGDGLAELADYVWHSLAAGSCPHTVLVACFDRQGDTPRPKDIEHGKRAKCGTAFETEDVEALLARGALPLPWHDALADRRARGAVVRALGARLLAMFAARPGAARELIVQGAGARAARALREEDGTCTRSECEASGQAGLLGEGEVAMVYWARRLRERTDGVILLLSVDTDLVALAALHASERTWVVLHHRATGVHAVDVAALTNAVARRLGLSAPEFVLVCISRGTDFSERAVSGAADWAPYVRAAAEHVRLERARAARESRAFELVSAACDRLDAGVALRVLRATMAGRKKAALKADQAWLARALWTLAYWKAAPEGRGDEVDPMAGVAEDGRAARCMGWQEQGGKVVEASAQLRGGVLRLPEAPARAGRDA
jgi:hypothetical protein